MVLAPTRELALQSAREMNKIGQHNGIKVSAVYGGAPEAGPEGNFAHPYAGKMTVREMYERLDDLGSEDSQPLYQRAWAMASPAIVTPSVRI